MLDAAMDGRENPLNSAGIPGCHPLQRIKMHPLGKSGAA